MNKVVGILLILLMAGSLLLVFNYNFPKAQATDSLIVDWTKTYPTLNQSASYVAQTKSGGYAIAGAYLVSQDSNSGYSVSNGLLINTDSAGTQLWNATYRVGGMWYCFVDSITQTLDGGYALTMHGTNPPEHYYANGLIKTDLAGNEIWNDTTSGYSSYGPIRGVFPVLQSIDGSLVWGGNYQVNLSFPKSIFLTKTDLSDNQIWGRIYPNASATDIIQTNDGGFAVAGNKLDGSSLLIKTDSAGNSLWNRTYGNFSISNILQTSDSGFLFQGNGLLFKTDSSGNLTWSQTFTGTLGAQTSDGGYLFPQGNMLIRTDASGNILWSQAFEASISSIIKVSNQDYVLAGTYPSGSSSNTTVWLAKISLLTTSPTPTLPFTDNFANLGQWTLVDGTWTLISGGVQGSAPASSQALMYAGSNTWTDYQITAVVTVPAGQFAGIVFRYTDPNNYYWAGIGDWGNQYGISKVVGGVYSEIIGSGSASSNGAGTYTIKVVSQGSAITLYVNGVSVLAATDSTFSFGAIGLRTYGTTIQVGSLNASTPAPTPTATPTPTPTPTLTVSPTATPTASPTQAPTTNPTTNPTQQHTSSTSTPIPTAKADPSTSPTPTVPEFPSWIIMPMFFFAALATLVYSRKKKQDFNIKTCRSQMKDSQHKRLKI